MVPNVDTVRPGWLCLCTHYSETIQNQLPLKSGKLYKVKWLQAVCCQCSRIMHIGSRVTQTLEGEIHKISKIPKAGQNISSCVNLVFIGVL